MITERGKTAVRHQGLYPTAMTALNHIVQSLRAVIKTPPQTKTVADAYTSVG